LDKLEENKINRKTNEFIIICKAINFENLIVKSNDRFTDSHKLEEILKTKFNEEINIYQYSDINNEKSFYFYRNKNLFIPEYLVEYSFIKDEHLNLKQSMEVNQDVLISSFTNKIEISNNFYENFNEASRMLYNNEFVNIYFHQNVKKYFPCKNVNITELSNMTFFFIKSSLIQFINLCFPYIELEEFKTKFNEITENIEQFGNIQNKYNLEEGIMQVNLFGCKIKENDFTSFINLQELCLANNRLEFFDFVLLPVSLKSLDISHNLIKEFNHCEKSDLKTLDISYNRIHNVNDILTIIRTHNEVEYLNFICNPLKIANRLDSKNCIKSFLCDYPEESNIQLSMNTENHLKQVDLIYDTYSFTKRFSEFSANELFIDKTEKTNENNSILILSKKKLKSIPSDIDINIQTLYLNINKIPIVENLHNLTNLVELHIQNNKLTAIEDLNSLSKLKKLDLSNNNIKTIQGISSLKLLDWLNVENNLLDNIFIIELLELESLIELHAAGNYIHNLRECLQLKGLTNLSILDLTGNDVCRVSDFKHYILFYLANLKMLNRCTIEKTDITAAKEYFDGRLTTEILESKIGNQPLAELIELTLSACKLKDFDSVFNCLVYPKLTKLDLSRNLFSSFRIFGSLPGLKTLYINSNLFDKILNKKDKLIQGKGILGLPVIYK
jgi:hypothetical protein